MMLLWLRISGDTFQVQRVVQRLSMLDGVTRVDRVVDRISVRCDGNAGARGMSGNGTFLADAIAVEVDNPQTAELAGLLAQREARAGGAELEVVAGF